LRIAVEGNLIVAGAVQGDEERAKALFERAWDIGADPLSLGVACQLRQAIAKQIGVGEADALNRGKMLVERAVSMIDLGLRAMMLLKHDERTSDKHGDLVMERGAKSIRALDGELVPMERLQLLPHLPDGEGRGDFVRCLNLNPGRPVSREAKAVLR
jgi:hypothetical protein